MVWRALEEDAELESTGDSKRGKLKIMQPCRRMTEEGGGRERRGESNPRSTEWTVMRKRDKKPNRVGEG